MLQVREFKTGAEVLDNVKRTRAYFHGIDRSLLAAQKLRGVTRELEIIKAERDQYRATADHLRAINVELMSKIAEIRGLTKSQPDMLPVGVEPEPLKLTALTVEKIQRAVCAHFKVSRTDMLSHRRTAEVVWPRQIAMYLCQQHTHNSLPVIGRMFGGRDHTTVLHAVRKIVGLLSGNIQLDSDLKAILAELLTQESNLGMTPG